MESGSVRGVMGVAEDGWASQAALPGGGQWVSVTEDLRASFAGCPDLPRMGKRMAQLKRSARFKAELHGNSPEPVPVAGSSDRSFITREPIHLLLSFENSPDSLSYEGAPVRRWHLSMSQVLGRDRQPVSDPEILGIIAGFPDATEVATYTVATGSAHHADIPVDSV